MQEINKYKQIGNVVAGFKKKGKPGKCVLRPTLMLGVLDCQAWVWSLTVFRTVQTDCSKDADKQDKDCEGCHIYITNCHHYWIVLITWQHMSWLC